MAQKGNKRLVIRLSGTAQEVFGLFQAFCQKMGDVPIGRVK